MTDRWINDTRPGRDVRLSPSRTYRRSRERLIKIRLVPPCVSLVASGWRSDSRVLCSSDRVRRLNLVTNHVFSSSMVLVALLIQARVDMSTNVILLAATKPRKPRCVGTEYRFPHGVQ